MVLIIAVLGEFRPENTKVLRAVLFRVLLVSKRVFTDEQRC